MLRNYIKIAWRNIKSSKVFTAINIFGLAVGLASCLIISLYVIDQVSYDSFHEKADRIYRIVKTDTTESLEEFNSEMPPVLAEEMVQTFPSIEATTRLWNISGEVRRNDQSRVIREDKLLYADSTFFQIFSFDLISGDIRSVLKEPFSIVLTEEMAKKYFPGENPVNKQLIIGEKKEYTVTGIVSNTPENSSISYNFLLSFSSLEHPEEGIWMARDAGWQATAFQTYFLLKENQDIDFIQNQFSSFLERQTDSDFILKYQYNFESLENLHLYSPARDGVAEVEDIHYIYLFISVAIIILVIAFINYINLSTAKSVRRAREVGIRKVSGAMRGSLIIQFIGEAVILGMISFILAIVLVEVLLPWVEAWFEITFVSGIFENPEYLLLIFGVSVLASIVAGLYPALFLSGYSPASVLYNRIHDGRGQGIIRKVLVTVQVVVFSGLIISSYVIYSQVQYAQERNLGVDIDQLFMVILRDPQIQDNPGTFKNRIEQLAGVKNTTVSSSQLYFGNSRYTIRESEDDERVWVTNFWIDEDFVETMGLEIIEGRNIIPSTGTFRTALINETAAEVFEWSDPIGKTLPKKGSIINKEGEKVEVTYRISGVVKDFHYQSLKREIEPVFLIPRADNFGYYLTVKMAGSDTDQVLKGVRDIWEDMTERYEFDYRFLDNAFERIYSQELRTGKLFSAFTLIGMLIACLGLFSLSAFTAERMTKEIGIRKVVGATLTDIVKLLGINYFKIILTGFLISIPISWYGMKLWLTDYAYKIDIGPGIFLMAGGVAVFIALLTVSWQSIRAASANPVDSLRSE